MATKKKATKKTKAATAKAKIKPVIVTDYAGIEYKLTAKKMVEQSQDEFIREVLRTDLKIALLESKKDGDFVGIDYYCYPVSKPLLSEPCAVDFYVALNSSGLDIGCRTFEGSNAKKLIKWATKGK